MELLQLTPDEVVNATTGISEVFDTNGNLTQTSCNTMAGTRLE